MACGSKQITQTEVNDFNVAGLAYQNILNLEVSMNDTVAMTVVQSTRDLSAELPSLLLLQSSM